MGDWSVARRYMLSMRNAPPFGAARKGREVDSQRFNLTRGDIAGKLLLVSLPIIGTQLMLMGYNLVDMFLLGRVGSDAVAASGSAGMYMWLGGGLMLVGRIGAEIGVAQAKGARDDRTAADLSHSSLFLAMALGVGFGALCFFAPAALIGFLNIKEPGVAADAADYLAIVGLGVPFVFVSSAVSGIFTGAGNSRAPFVVNAIGLVLNAMLDPLFIFTLGMGVRGAAVATSLSQFVGCLLSFYWLLARRDRPFAVFPLWRRPSPALASRILRWTVPVSAENLLFTFFSMVVAREIARYGSDAIAVFRVGSQAESLCWLVCLGFSSGITAFIGQNFGAGLWSRIWRGFRQSLLLILCWGVAVSVLFWTSGRWLTDLFVPEERIAEMGGTYLWILAFCQVFFCMESIAAGALRGLGRTTPPSIASIASNALRVPIVYYLAATDLGLNGIWWAISLTASLRGVWVFLWFMAYARGKPVQDVGHRDSVREELSREVPSGRFFP